MSRVSESIKTARLNQGLSKKQLGKKLGVSENFIEEIESGRRVLNENLLRRFSNVLNYQVDDAVLTSDDEEEVIEVREIPKKVNETMESAFSSVIMNFKIYDYSFSEAKGEKQLPIFDNKIEGFPKDKVFFIEIEKDDMLGFRIAKGDIALCHKESEPLDDNIYLIEVNEKRAVRQVKRIDNNNLLLISNKSTLRTETVDKKIVKVLGRLVKIEIKL
ncbi:MAG: LexA family transcriptional regulator [Clostridiaceae bacterium]